MPTTEQIKELRSVTGCGIVDCKEALAETGDDLEAAITHLRKKGIAKAAKKAIRETAEGAVVHYVHSNGKIGVLVAVLCETDFVARNEKFKELAHNIALHIAAMDPVAINPDEIPEELIARERELAEHEAKESGKPEEIKNKIIEGKISKFKEEKALLKQPFVKEPEKTIEELINNAVQELGENVTIREFSRIEI